jgi:DNA ligase (NAD+)
MQLTNDERIYLRAKHSYYIGVPIMTDVEFDSIENKLRDKNSEVVEIVGYDVDDLMFSHPTRMRSLQKIQVADSRKLPLTVLDKWLSTSNRRKDIEASPKFDGSACNMIFENGELKLALTRGNGIEGNDITDKLKIITTSKIDTKEKIEIRGEVVIPEDVFESKYSVDYANPRNFVAGKLSTDEIENCIHDFRFVAFEARDSKGLCIHNTLEFLKKNNFEVPVIKKFPTSHEFPGVYDFFLNYRENESPYQLDGMVLKFNEEIRESIGETDHHPKWAIAIKFPAEEAKTRITGISWRIGKNGDYTPVGMLETVQLAGTRVSNVSLHNYGNVSRNKILPGALVTIIKSGDIIPKVIHVDEPSTEDPSLHRPHNCYQCNSELVVNDIHLICNNHSCQGKEINRLSYGIRAFGNKRVGGSAILKLHEAGIKSIEDFWNPVKMNKSKLISTGLFKIGRALDIIFEAKYKTKEIDLWLVIYSLCLEDVGASSSQQLSNYLANINYDFKGLTKAGINRVIDKKSDEYNRIMQFINQLTIEGVKVKYPEEVNIPEDAIKYEMTGSPKEFGFAKKSEFTDLAKTKGALHSKLNSDCNYLITDSLDSPSSKMSKARKLGVEIITYDEFINLIK